MKELTERYELLLTKKEKKALKELSKHAGISMGNVVRNAIRAQAKRKKVWK